MTPVLSNFLACVTCMSGNSEAELAQTMAILLLLAVLAGVFGAIFKFMSHLRNCARNAAKRP
jgi:hypothetical protein